MKKNDEERKRSEERMLHYYTFRLEETSENDERFEFLKEMKTRYERVNQYTSDMQQCKVPDSLSIEEKMAVSWSNTWATSEENTRLFVWKEMRWIGYYTHIYGYSDELIDTWCKDFGEKMDYSIYWGKESDCIEDIHFREIGWLTFRYAHWNTKNFKITATNTVTEITTVIQNQNSYGYGEISLWNSGESYKITIESDNYWYLVLDP